MDLSIIIVNWNSVAYLRKCLDSIFAQSKSMSFEIVVVDCASADGCGEMLTGFFPSVRFIQSETNLGFARANNLGFRHSTGQNILFLNPDTEIVGKALDVLYEQLETLPRVGIVGCQLRNTDGTVQTSCIQSYPTIVNQMLDSDLLRNWSPRSSLWGMASLFSANPRASEVEAVIGACLLLKRSVFEQVECFSDDYFMYGEDIDLCFKVARAGYRNYYVPNALVTHHGGKSSSQRRRIFPVVTMRESTWRFLRKFRGRYYAAGYRVAMAVCAVFRLLCALLLLPFGLLVRSGNRVLNASRKWLAILGWSLHLKLDLD